MQCCGSGSVGSICFWASRIRILLSSSKNRKKTLVPTVLWLLYDFLSLKNYIPSKSNKQKYLEKIKKRKTLVAYWRSLTKIAGSGSIVRGMDEGRERDKTSRGRPTYAARSLPQYNSAFATRVLLSTYVCVKGEKAWGRICKHLRTPAIDSTELIP